MENKEDNNKHLMTKLEEKEEFRKWKQNHNDSYLVHIFIMDSVNEINNYSIGYYNKDDTITTFEIKGDDISIKSDEEIFKPDDEKVKELDISQAKLTYNQIMDIAEDFRIKNYKSEIPNKNISILQNLEQGIIWNITLITIGFNTLNIKIDANTGEVLGHNLTSLMQMGNFMK